MNGGFVRSPSNEVEDVVDDSDQVFAVALDRHRGVEAIRERHHRRRRARGKAAEGEGQPGPAEDLGYDRAA